MKNKFLWDQHSDQPYPIKDKVYKKKMKRKNFGDLLPLVFTNLVLFPMGIIGSYLFGKSVVHSADFFALCVNLDKGDQQCKLVNELGCTSVQIRVPLGDIGNLDAYVAFAKQFDKQKILVSILQDREHIDDHALLGKNIGLIFSAFVDITRVFQIGNAINRSKWGFFSIAEYLKFYKTVQDVRDNHFSTYTLVGPSVIDYEYHFTIRALFNGFKLRFDKLSALLYVDRRGAPENTQLGIFDTIKKIDFLHALSKLSTKTSSELLVTEVNWPISNTAPWAPTSETECVDEDVYANYMLRFYFLALASGKIESVYWHQLIASGYGLIDTREGLRKRSAFYAFKTMLCLLQAASFEQFDLFNGVYRLKCIKDGKTIEVLWLNADEPQRYITDRLVLDKLGEKVLGDIYISASPIYVLG